MDEQIVVCVDEAEADSERLEMLSLQLREELLATDVTDVGRLPAGEAPVGTRSAELAALGGLLVTVASTLTSLSQIIAVVRGWVDRGEEERSVEITIGSNTLRLTSASQEDQAKLIAAFLEASSVSTA